MPRSTPPSTAGARSVRASTALAAALLLVSTAACTDEEKPRGAQPRTPAATPSSAPSLEVDVTRVAGTLKPAARRKLAKKVSKPLRVYVEKALLGDYPRSSFGDAFTVFTKDARRQARRDRDLLTGRGFSDAASVTAKRLRAKLTAFAPGGRPAGATARVRLVLDVDGSPVTMAGRVLLTPVKGRWRIFGYDLRRDDVAGVAG